MSAAAQKLRDGCCRAEAGIGECRVTVIHRQRADGALGGAEFLQRLPNVNILWQALSVGDVNGDKLPDVLFADAWLRQRVVPTSTPPAPGP